MIDDVICSVTLIIIPKHVVIIIITNAIQLQNIINFNDASEQSPRNTIETYTNTKSAAVVPLESMLQLIKNIFVIKMIPMNKYVFNWAILQTAMKHLKQILEIQSN